MGIDRSSIYLQIPILQNSHPLENTADALAALELQAEVEKVTDFGEIASYGVLRTPGLVVDEKVLVSGRVPSSEEIGEMLSART